MRAPAVVGSWPEPFAQASTPESERRPVSRRLPRRPTRPATRSPRPLGRGPAASTVGEPAERPGPAGPGRAVGARARRPGRRRSSSDGPAASGVFADFERLRRRLPAAGARPAPPTSSAKRIAEPGWSPPCATARSRRPGSSPASTRPGSSEAAAALGERSLRGPLRGRWRRSGGEHRAARERERRMRSPLAYAPRPGRSAAAGGGRGDRLPGLVRGASPSSTRTRSCSPAPAAAVVVAGLLAGAGEALRGRGALGR